MTWTPEHDKLLLRLQPIHKLKDLAAIFGCSKSAVAARLSELRREAVRRAGADLMEAWTCCH